MRLFINTGGKGTRLYPLTKDIPKPMVRIADKPILHHLVDWAKKYDINEIVMMNGHLSEKIIDYFKDGSHINTKIYHSNEPYPLGSGGPIKFASGYIDGTFAYISGDVLCDIDFYKMKEFHLKNNADMTILVHKSSHPNDSDILKINKDGKVLKFISKHDDHKDSGDLSNAGLCIIEPKILELMDKENFNFENYIYPKALDNNLNIFSYHSEEYFKDMGTIERLKEGEEYLKSKQKSQ